MRKCRFVLVIALYLFWLNGCGRQENAITESGVLDSTVSAVSFSAEDYEGLKKDNSVPLGSAQEKEDMEVPYIPELNYHQSMRICASTPTAYACWKDLLIIGAKVYRRKNGIYLRTGERLEDWFQIEDDIDSYQLKQDENLLIAQDQVKGKIVVYDMDTSKQISEYSFESLLWQVYKGKIYYVKRSGGIFEMDPFNGESEMVHAFDGGGVLMIRDNGDMALTKRNETDSDIIECWMLCHDEQGELSAKKVWETDDKYLWMLEFNNRGQFLCREYYDEGPQSGYNCLNVDGKIEEIMIEEWVGLKGLMIVEEGYFLWDSQRLSEKEKVEVLGNFDRSEEVASVVDSISYYDFQGNRLKTWQLIEDEMLEAGYRLVQIVYGNSGIFAFYENEEIEDLYISKVQPWEGEGTIIQN